MTLVSRLSKTRSSFQWNAVCSIASFLLGCLCWANEIAKPRPKRDSSKCKARLHCIPIENCVIFPAAIINVTCSPMWAENRMVSFRLDKMFAFQWPSYFTFPSSFFAWQAEISLISSKTTVCVCGFESEAIIMRKNGTRHSPANSKQLSPASAKLFEKHKSLLVKRSKYNWLKRFLKYFSPSAGCRPRFCQPLLSLSHHTLN